MSGPPPGVRTVSEAKADACTLVLVRHGEATCNVAGRVGGPAGCTGLTDLGRAQAEALRRRLAEAGELRGATAIYSSVLVRAVETAEIISPEVGEGHLSVVRDCALCELHPGESDGLTWEQFSAHFGEPDWDRDPDALVAPGGESWTGFVHRAALALEDLVGRHSGEMVVVVCHAGVIESALIRLLGTTRFRLGLRTAHTSLTVFEYDGGEFGWRLLRYNDSAHLLGAALQIP